MCRLVSPSSLLLIYIGHNYTIHASVLTNSLVTLGVYVLTFIYILRHFYQIGCLEVSDKTALFVISSV